MTPEVILSLIAVVLAVAAAWILGGRRVQYQEGALESLSIALSQQAEELEALAARIQSVGEERDQIHSELQSRHIANARRGIETREESAKAWRQIERDLGSLEEKLQRRRGYPQHPVLFEMKNVESETAHNRDIALLGGIVGAAVRRVTAPAAALRPARTYHVTSLRHEFDDWLVRSAVHEVGASPMLVRSGIYVVILPKSSAVVERVSKSFGRWELVPSIKTSDIDVTALWANWHEKASPRALQL